MSTIISGNQILADGKPGFPVFIKLMAHVFSWIFHPLFISLYVTVYLTYLHPYVFVSLSEKGKVFNLLSIFVNTVMFPALSVFLMWRLKFTQSIFLRTQKERIIPYAAAMIFYFWTWYVSKSLHDKHEIFTNFLFGSFLTVIAAWMANIYFKISMHALAIGGMAFFVLWSSFAGDGTSGLYPTVALLIAGIVCTARMIVSDHRPVDIYAGFLIGILCQAIAIII